jgi:hypothetical protein
VIFPDRPRRGFVVAAAAVAALLVGAPAQAAVVSAAPDPLPTFDGTVWATAYAGNTLYVGGDFTRATAGGKTVARSRLAAIDATTGALLSWAPAVNGTVRAIAISGSAVYVGGNFSTVAGAKRDSLARVDAATGKVHAFSHSMSGMPYSLTVGHGRLYVGGNITAVDGTAYGRLAAFSLSSGALDASWRPAADSTVESVVVSGERVYVGGKFGSVGGVSGTRKLAAVLSNGAVDTGFRPAPEVVAHAIAVGTSGVYAALGGQGGTVGAYGFDGRIRWTLTMDGDPQAITALDGTVYIGGHFDNVCRSTRTGDRGACIDGNVRRVKLAAADEDGGALLAWTANGNGSSGVHAMAAGSGRFVAGGAFTTINGAARARLAQFS